MMALLMLFLPFSQYTHYHSLVKFLITFVQNQRKWSKKLFWGRWWVSCTHQIEGLILEMYKRWKRWSRLFAELLHIHIHVKYNPRLIEFVFSTEWRMSHHLFLFFFRFPRNIKLQMYLSMNSYFFLYLCPVHQELVFGTFSMPTLENNMSFCSETKCHLQWRYNCSQENPWSWEYRDQWRALFDKVKQALVNSQCVIISPSVTGPKHRDLACNTASQISCISPCHVLLLSDPCVQAFSI